MTATVEQAIVNAKKWLAKMVATGFCDIEMTGPTPGPAGYWTFEFRHTVTGVVVNLEMHGEYEDSGAFPRVYWNGSSCSNPEIEQFAAPGFGMTFRRVSNA